MHGQDRQVCIVALQLSTIGDMSDILYACRACRDTGFTVSEMRQPILACVG